MAGALLFGVGGILDLIWHVQFGIERELKILFSPTHLLLMTAMLLLCFGPVRAAWMTPGPLSSGRLQCQSGRLPSAELRSSASRPRGANS